MYFKILISIGGYNQKTINSKTNHSPMQKSLLNTAVAVNTHLYCDLYRFYGFCAIWKKINVMIFCVFVIDIISVIIYKKCMRDKNFFLQPQSEWQRRYEALRASFVDRLPAKVVADRFGYSQNYVNLLRHQFTHGKLDFNEPPPEGKGRRRRVDSLTRSKICNWR